MNQGIVEFRGTADVPAYVRIDNGKVYANCVLDSLVTVDFSSHRPLEGSARNDSVVAMMNKISALYDDMQDYEKKLKAEGVEPSARRDSLYGMYKSSVFPEIFSIVKNAITSNDNGVGLNALSVLMGMRDLTPAMWDEVYAAMPPYVKGSVWAKGAQEQYANMRKSMIGMPMIDFEAQTVDGGVGRLSDYVGKGKYVLVDFWASWCRPCRMEAAETLMPLYDKLKGNDRFEILGVAVWDEPAATLKALNESKYPWPQLIGAGETPSKLYGFDGIPMIILFGPDGTILDRGLRGENLVNTVEKYVLRAE